ncbi:hypothetical protein [Phaeobacter gallaeciensis]|uniref:hypothetical protein n=1 Tax=Phaeobacter gallaeciensis TaxID=60890 RepID=UPI0023800F07|nr:hypothetical protein [Phaeobacter gallaeciensis]
MTGIERVLAEDLELRRAWRDLKSAERALSRIIKQRLNEAERDEFDTEMCGGCGAIHPDQRCIGCLHDFYPRKKNV